MNLRGKLQVSRVPSGRDGAKRGGAIAPSHSVSAAHMSVQWQAVRRQKSATRWGRAEELNY
jgi:hypothetical protein